VPTTFSEVSTGDWAALQIAMSLPGPDLIHQRFQTSRRCFGLKAADQIVAYGWATRGQERVGELERDIDLRDDEVYVWDCGTVPAWRGQRCYTALLDQMRRQLHQEGLARIWIGASRRNQPSVQGIRRAGFQRVLDLAYCRLGFVTLLLFAASGSATSTQLDAAYRVLTRRSHQHFGRITIGLYRNGVAAHLAHTAQEANP
jgi:ribosomal protein S18 acetylase RimI-like enzyme